MTDRPLDGPVVVTGAQGFLGRYVVEALTARGIRVIGVGRSPQSDEHFTHDLDWLGRRRPAPLTASLRAAATSTQYSYARLDVNDGVQVTALLDDARPTAIVHSAAAIRDEPFASLVASNVRATHGLFESISASAWRPYVVLVSSGSVYGTVGAEHMPLRADGPTEPGDLYGASKRASEDVARIMARLGEIRLLVVRPFNLLGSGLQDRHLAASLAGQLAAIARGLTPARIQVGPLRTTRDFIDVRDVAEGIIALVDAGATTTANLASGVETPTSNILDTLVAKAGLGAPPVIDRLGGRKADVERSWADISNLQATGFEFSQSLESSLAEMLAYYAAFAGDR